MQSTDRDLLQSGDGSCQCGWTDPRNGINWHVRFTGEFPHGLVIAFGRPAESREYTLKNAFGRCCDRLEDHELAEVLDLAIDAAKS